MTKLPKLLVYRSDEKHRLTAGKVDRNQLFLFLLTTISPQLIVQISRSMLLYSPTPPPPPQNTTSNFLQVELESFIIYLHSETQVSGRLGMSGGISPRHAQNPLPGERRKTLSITHHALSPSHHHLYIIHLINWLQRFYRITMSLKRPFVPKSDVKHWFTTTTTTTTTNPPPPPPPRIQHSTFFKWNLSRSIYIF